MQKVESVHLFVPNESQKTSYTFHSLGFLSEHFFKRARFVPSIVYIYGSDNLIRNLNSHSWELTDAHIGYV